MKQVTLGILLIASTIQSTFGQSSEPRPQFVAADIHASPKSTNAFPRSGPVRGGRYEVKTATMVDLIRMAYGMDTDKILGGPNWLELDRFDVIARLPPESTPDAQKLMLQSLLEDRFKLVLHKDSKPLPTYALTVGKKPQLKEAAGTEQTGCRPQASSGAPGPGGVVLNMSGPTGAMTTINLGPGMTVHYECRNMSMAAFASGLRGMVGSQLGSNPVLDETGLKGNWNFDLHYSMQMIGFIGGDTGERVSLLTAVDKQLGLKLEEKPVATPVLVVDSVNRKPTDNPPDVAEILPPVPVPTEFEVASIKPASAEIRMSRFQMQPGGHLLAQGMPLRFLVGRAFNTNNNDQILGLPEFANTDRYDINAKAASEGPTAGPMDMDAVAPMLLALLVDRFKMTYHTEDRQMSAYSLAAGKPKMQKADPNSRIFCKNIPAPPGAPPGSRVLKCQNATMAMFAERLQNLTQEVNWPVADVTGLEGGWDFTLTFSMRFQMAMGGGGRGGPADASAPPSASEPVDGLTLFEAVEKQLGLKLERQKRTVPIIVIDHIEQKPSEN